MATLFTASSNNETAASFVRPGDITPGLYLNAVTNTASGAATYTATLPTPTSPTIWFLDGASLAQDCTFTLPTASASVVGTNIKVYVKGTNAATKVFKITTGSASIFMRGGVMVVGSTTPTYIGAGTTSVAIKSNGSDTQAGILAGTMLEFTCISATEWQLFGWVVSGGTTAATPFSTTA